MGEGSTTAPARRDQATYLVDQHMFALWSWSDGAPGAPPPVGESATIALLTPTGDGGGHVVRNVECALVEPEALADVPIGSPDTSVDAWRAWVGGSCPALPTAAHATPDATGTAVVSAERAVATYRQTSAVGAEMRSDLTAELRPYQIRGVSWLREATAHHGGALLADEMGLGKTLQTIGYFSGSAVDGPQLVVCPASLIANWAREIGRFAPALRAEAWRGGSLAGAQAGTVVLVGYPTLRLHGSDLAGHNWATVAFDEAQVLKNPRTQVSKAARSLTADARIALTGTPVENNLEELWALLNLVAPGLFPHRTQFRRRYVRPIIEGSSAAGGRLKRAIEPVVLTRRKSQVANTLPPKIHVELSCDLMPEQERVYDAVLDQAVEDGFGSGAGRRTKILAALTALKQVCNHPGLITGELDELADRSGKLERCTEVVAYNLENDSPTLVFTQYRRTGELLARHFAEQLGVSLPFFHGGMNQEQRTAMIEQFQASTGPKLMAISLKAGGTGLNLTRATEIIHYDRWWNPAVEAQASDRAHRIGQTKTVTVTTLTTTATVEEHIAAMHDRKSRLSDLTEVSTVAELTRMGDDRLVEILRRKREV